MFISKSDQGRPILLHRLSFTGNSRLETGKPPSKILGRARSRQRGSPLCKLLGAEEIGLFWLVDSYWGYLISHWLAILLIMVGFSTKPNAETAVCHWIMIWCWFLLTKIDVMYTVQDIWWGLLADEKRESIIEDILKNGSQGHIYSTTNSSACKMLCLHVSSSSWIRGSSSSDE